ncbi:hypothetical protein FA95DRAFT_351392 [Auriscalpium vulgare]|uniref:Uncharacterized protein n=1 Tax=Auriscalpium vulgare TaxID=40419 RepID=A0ACB8S602_9AGAM|nr:hypothetical protein FA95DRAFT_351392 [Auriscalpium vulgare]
MALIPVQVLAVILVADVYLYGIYSLLCCFTLVTLLCVRCVASFHLPTLTSSASRSRKVKGNATNKCLVAATLVMHIASTAGVILHVVDYLRFVALDPVDDSARNSAKAYAITSVYDSLSYSIPTIQFVFGDAIVVWRVWVIWQHSWRVTIGPFILLFATTSVVLAQIVTTTTYDGVSPALSRESGAGRSTPAKVYLASLVLTLCTNGVVTGLIACRAW